MERERNETKRNRKHSQTKEIKNGRKKDAKK